MVKEPWATETQRIDRQRQAHHRGTEVTEKRERFYLFVGRYRQSKRFRPAAKQCNQGRGTPMKICVSFFITSYLFLSLWGEWDVHWYIDYLF